jgi:hypothetical protein
MNPVDTSYHGFKIEFDKNTKTYFAKDDRLKPRGEFRSPKKKNLKHHIRQLFDSKGTLRAS